MEPVVINPQWCKGCGICQGACPKRGVTIAGFTYDQIEAQIDAAFDEAAKAEGV